MIDFKNISFLSEEVFTDLLEGETRRLDITAFACFFGLIKSKNSDQALRYELALLSKNNSLVAQKSIKDVEENAKKAVKEIDFLSDR